MKDDSFETLINYSIFFIEENPDKAIELYKKAIEINQENTGVIGNLAIMLHQKGEFDEAKIYYELAKNKETKNINLINAYGILKRDMGLE